MADSLPRRRRLLSLLPRIIAEQPENSPVSVLLGIMAEALAEMDEALDRTLRDHWIGLARGETPSDEALRILERLGPHLGSLEPSLDLVRETGEPREDYRLRLMRADRIRVDANEKATVVLEANWVKAVRALVDEAKKRLSADLASLAPGDVEGVSLTWQDHWSRLAGSDPALRNDADALALPPVSDRKDIPEEAANRWGKVLIGHWEPVLSRHWNELGLGNNAQAGPSEALSRLGGLLGLARLKRRHRLRVNGAMEILEIHEEIEAYRRRIALTAQVQGYGLTSPDALLDLAIITLGAEPCSRRQGDRDAVIAHGVPLGVARSCPVCRSKSAESCPNAGQWVIEARIIDNPPQRMEMEWRLNAPLKPHGVPFNIESSSLTTAIPELRLQALDDQPIRYPYLHNRDTGEIMLYAGDIGPGQILRLRPQVDPDEWAAFDSHEAVDVYPWHGQYPSGSAVVIDRDGNSRDVSAQICFLTGTRFPEENVAPDDPDAPRYAAMDAAEGVRFADALNQGDTFDNARFGEAHLGSSGQRVRMPRLRPGRDQWIYGAYEKKQVKAIVGDNHPGDLLNKAPDQVADIPVKITLAWWVRPPALFRLCIPKSDWVVRAAERGALDLLARLVQKSRAAGVTALVDFPEPTQRECHSVSERLGLSVGLNWREHHILEDTEPKWRCRVDYRETQPLAEGVLAWRGVFDVTRLDGSHFD
jgi:hypothetical protein